MPEMTLFLMTSHEYQTYIDAPTDVSVEVDVLEDDIQVQFVDIEHNQVFTIHIHKPGPTVVQQSLDPLISYPYGSTDILAAFTKEVSRLSPAQPQAYGAIPLSSFSNHQLHRVRKKQIVAGVYKQFYKYGRL
ncbi:hypothetical protein GEMRC1_008741 [Eukaryota sp. GEM-RC1]